ncbi:poly [ADP-ribose] polymerase tankyrase-2-like [Haliotis asinina]|uniref:poly [ADP-ribose] polymerase tankyrase-2-like n=1 Tax=Haliotis asinina TaxID=109174 RepID=UPI003531A60A
MTSTDPSPSNAIPPSPLTTQHSDLHASTTDASEDLTPSNTVLPAPETTQDSDAHAIPSPSAGRCLSNASYDGDLERVKRILSAGHVDISNRGGGLSWTPVMAAAVNGQRDVVEFLVGRGADLSLVDMGGNNVLHLACVGGDLETVKLILDLDVVDVNARNNYGKTAAHRARVWGRLRVLDFLVSRGIH